MGSESPLIEEMTASENKKKDAVPLIPWFLF